MRERPLSITIAGWFILTTSILSIIKGIVSGVPSTAATPGDFTKANWSLELLIVGLLATFSVFILQGKTWARTGIVIALALDLLRTIFLDWSDSGFFLPVDIFVDLIVLIVLYQPRSRKAALLTARIGCPMYDADWRLKVAVPDAIADTRARIPVPPLAAA